MKILKPSDSVEMNNHYIALIDILGFTDLVSTNSLEEVISLLKRFLEYGNSAGTLFASDDSGDIQLGLDHYVFSDTIVMWTSSVDLENKRREEHQSMMLYSYVSRLLENCILHHIPVRGAIAFGPLCIDPEAGIIVGKPLIDAYKLEQAQEWIGVSIHHSCSSRPQHDEASIHISKYVPPLKSVTVERPFGVIDWTTALKVAPDIWVRRCGYDAHERFSQFMAAGLTKTASVKAKYENTQAFVEYTRLHRPVTMFAA